MQTALKNTRYLSAVFLSNACAAIAFAILSPTLVANLTRWHTSALLIAVTTSIWAVPNVIGGPFYSRLIARYNPRVCLLAGVFCSTVTLLLFPVFPNVWVWIALQLVTGAVLGHFFLVTEAWLNHFSGESIRSRVTAIYGILPAIGYAVGAAIYSYVGFKGSLPFVAAAAAMAIGLMPLLLLRGAAGDVIVGGEKRLWATARVVPLLLAISVVAGMLETVPWGVYQIYALDNGFPVRAAGWILPAFFGGQILLTYPIGWVADRVGRRTLLVWSGCTSALLMSALYFFGRTFAIWGIVFVTGGVFNVVYTLGLATLGQRFESKALVSAGAAFMTAYSIGAVVGPPLVGALMDQFGPRALPLTLGVAAALVAIFATAARSEWNANALGNFPRNRI
jgi:MFS family permease